MKSQWPMVKLNEACSLNMGQSPDSSGYNDEGRGIPFYQGNADFGALTPVTRFYCDNPTKIAHRGDILLSVRAPIGAVNIANETCCIGRGLAALTACDSVDAKFLYYAIKSKHDELNAKGTGSTFKAINKKALHETQIPLPVLAEQKNVASILDNVSGLAALRKRQIMQLDLLAKSRFIEMFGDSKAKFQRLGDICSVGSSKRVFVEELQTKGIPFFRGTEVGRLAEDKDIEPTLFITEEHYIALCKHTGKPKIGDLLLPSICPDGRVWCVNSERPFYFKDGRVLWVKVPDAINGCYLRFALSQSIIENYSTLASGITFAELKIVTLKEAPIPLPPLALQNEFAAFIEQLDKSKFTIRRSLEKLEMLYQALLQEYFG